VARETTRIVYIRKKHHLKLHPPDAGPVGTRLVHVVVEQTQEFAEAFATILRERADAVLLQGEGMHYVHRGQVIAFAAAHGLPASYGYREAVEEGWLDG